MGPISPVTAIINSFAKLLRKFGPQETLSGHRLREWWHSILGEHGRYSCYAIFLALPSDREAIRYLTEFGRELDIVSGYNCLVIALSDTAVRRSGFDEEIWDVAIQEQISGGYSVNIAQLFNVGLAKFPCMLFFQDIRSPEHVIATFEGMTAEEIAKRMRVLFTIIQRAVSSKKNPLQTLEDHRDTERLLKSGRAIVSELRSLAGKTFETAIVAMIKATIK